MFQKCISLLLAVTLLLGMTGLPVQAQEDTEPEAAVAQNLQAEPEIAQTPQASPEATAAEPSTQGGSNVILENEMFSSAQLAQAGQTLNFTFPELTVSDGQMILFAFDVRGQSVCSEISISLDFSGTDTTMRYYAPIQWSRIYMPVACSGSFVKATLTAKTGAVLVADATAENKGSATVDDLKLQSGMWMLDEYQDIVLDGNTGVANTNRDAYTQSGATNSNCIDLVISSCGNYVYSIGGGYLTITDVSNPSQPVIRSIFNNSANGGEYSVDYGDTRQIALIPRGGKSGDAVIFTGRISGAFIVDVSDPDHPVETAHYDALEMATGIAVYQNYAFIANRQYGVEVVDLSDIYNPVHLGTVARGGEVQSCKVVDGILYCGIYDKNIVEMYDIKDIFQPRLLGTAKLDGHGDGLTVATIDGKTYLYAGTGHHSATNVSGGPLSNLNYGNGNGLDIFDVTDPANPVLLSVSKNDGRFCHSKCDYWGAEVAIHDGRVYVYLLNTYNGVHIYDATNPAAPVRLAHVTARIYPDSPYYDTSNFVHINTVYPYIFQYNPDEYKQAPMGAMTVYEGALYMAGAYTDLHIYETELAHPIYEDPDPVAVAPTTPYYDDSLVVTRPGGQTVAIANHGEYMYVAAGIQGIHIYSKDLKTLYKTIPVEDVCYDLYIQNGILYSAEGRCGVAVYTIGTDGLTLTETKRYISNIDLVTTVRPSATGKFLALSVSSTTLEIVDISGTPKRVVKDTTSTQAYHHYVEVIGNGRYVVFWGLSGYEQWYDFGANDANSTPKKLAISPFRSRAAMAGGYTAYKGNTVIQTRSNGYIYYDPTQVTASQVEDMALNKLIRPVTGYGSTTKTSIYGRGYVYENLLISCDRIFGRMYITDISDIDNPVLLKSWTGVKGNADIATVVDKILYIPMGYEGIMMLDISEYLAPHIHCECCGDAKGIGGHTQCSEVQWTPISQALKNVGLTATTADIGKLPSGNYYLDTDLVVASVTNIGSKTSLEGLETTAKTTKQIRICLNGHNITSTKSRTIGGILAGSSLSITDCTGAGTVYGGSGAYGQINYVYAKGTLNIFGGNFTSEYTGTSGGLFVVAGDYCGDLDGDGDYDETDRKNAGSKSVMNLYGGRIYGGKAQDGGNIMVLNASDLNMYGGTIENGTATTKSGGNILSHSTGNLNIYGGSVKNGTAATYGGNIVNNYGTLRIYDGQIVGGKAGTFGGSIHNGKNFYLYGGTISGGTSGNNAGGNIMIGSGSQLNMYGGTIKDGTAPASYGGNIQILGTAYLCGGTIQNGTAKYGGGNVSVYNKGYAKTLKATSTRENLLIVDGKAPLGSNIYVGYSGGTTPTLNLTWGSFLRGSIYAGATAKTTISGDVKVSRLELSSGRTVTFGTLTDGAEIFVSMADRTGSFGTGTEQTLAYLKADYAIRQENGNLSLVAPDALNLRYDDRKNLSDLIGVTATNVTITDQVVTSKRIGSTTPDAAVLTYDAATDTLYAVGTGTATVMAGGKAYPVTVEAAPISLLMITGHSIGEGYLANGDLSVVSEAGQVYGSFGRESLVSSVGGLGYGADSRVSTSLDVYTAGQGGSPSGASALGWRWNQQTGEKVWVLNAAVSGACINEWLPGAKNHSGRYTDYFNTAVTMFQNAQTVLKNEVEAGHYTLSHMAMFYFNGANFQWYEGWTNAKLEADYATFWNGMKEALTVEVQGKSRTVETLGLVPAWSPSLATYSYDKAASFYMAASDAYPDIYIALDYRNWVTELDAFPVVEYTTQSGEFWIPESILHTNKGGTSDHSVFCYNDYTHHSQIGYNAIGICIADSLRARLAGEAATGAVIQTLDTKDAPETMTVDLGETVDLAVLLTPVWGSNVKITVSGELSHSYPLSVTATGYAGGRVTVSLGDQVLDTLTIQVRAQHKHCQCGGSAVGVGDHTQCEDAVFTPISTALARVGLTVDTADFGQLPSGYYYLDTDVTVTATGTLGSRVGGTSTQSKTVKDVVLCLNGNNITTTTGRIFGYIYMDSSLSICDCSGAQDGQGNWSFDGTVYGGNTSYGQIIYTLAGSALHIYGGNFTSANTGVTGGLIGISCESCGDQNGDGAYNDKDYTSCTLPTVFNLYNGRLYDGKANVGGNLALFHTASANLYGGVISGGVSATYAGNVVTFSTGALHIAGTVIENGTAGSYGGNVVVTSGSGKLTMKGGAVKNGVAKGYCGNIYNAGTFYLYDGLIEGGTSARYSGSVQSAKTFYMYGGTIRGGNARESGGNLMVGTGSRFNIYGGTIENGIAGEGGGNVQILGTTYLCGGTVQGGQAKYGGNICVYNKGEMYALKSGNTKEALLVTGGTATNGQGDCIYAGYTGGTTPTLSLKFGSYEGCVYAGNTAKVVLGETQLERLYLTNGRTVTMAGNANVTETVVAGDAYLDLAGYGFTGNAIGEGTLYLMDSSSDGYTLPTGKLTGSVSCRMSGSFKTDAKRYLVLDAENGYTSHRFYLGITKLTLRPGETGFGYKARFCGDEAVKARLDSFGFHLNLDGNDKVVTRSLTGSDLNTQKEYALVLRNFDIAAFGETPVNAKVFMVFKDGTQIETDCVSYSMQTMLQKLCGMMDDLSEEKRLAVKTMCQPYADIMKNWNIDALIH